MLAWHKEALILHGDTAECRIDGFEPLINPVAGKKIKMQAEAARLAKSDV
jgi:hypothetical protein